MFMDARDLDDIEDVCVGNTCSNLCIGEGNGSESRGM